MHGLLAGVLLSLSAWNAIAEPPMIAQITQAVQAGQYTKAAAWLPQALRQFPHNPQLQLAQGVVAQAQGRSTEAIAIFQQLKRQYPQAPEPYNNLAVIYASLGRVDLAESELQQALATQQSYATSWQNLHNLAATGAFSPKLKLISQWSQGVQTAAPKAPNAALAAKPASTLPPLGEPQFDQKPGLQAVVPAKNLQHEAAKTANAAKAPHASQAEKAAAAQPSPSHQPASKLSSKSRSAKQQFAQHRALRQAVHHWAQAWQNRHVAGYLASYAPQFQPKHGVSLRTWQQQRRNTLNSKRFIRLSLGAIQVVQLSPQQATVRFRQQYRDDQVTLRTTKVLQFQRWRGAWKIVRES